MQIYDEDGQACLFGPDTWFGKTSPAPFPPPGARTSGWYWRRSLELKAVAFMSLDLTPGAGNLLGEFYWEMTSPWLGVSSMLNTGVSPREGRESSLSRILQADPPHRYYLTPKACLGILRRALERGRELPARLMTALMIQARLLVGHTTEPADSDRQPMAFAANQRDEVRDLHDVAGALGAQPGMKQQTFLAADCPGVFTAGFSAGAGATAGSIAYGEELAPTLKGSASGNMMPTVLCLSDQGGKRMDCSEDITGTLRAGEHGHQPLIYENHGADSRCTGPYTVAPTVASQYGTGGNNTPLVEEAPICITGNAIDRQPQNGGNGIGYQENIAYTLTATDHHAVFSRQRVDVFKSDAVASTQSARQHKDATDLVLDRNAWAMLIRRLTPLECERLQGFPDGWTDIAGASDSARYKALGNSVAIPCVTFVLWGIALVLSAGSSSQKD